MWFARPRFWATRGSATHLHACCQCGARICRRDPLGAAADAMSLLMQLFLRSNHVSIHAARRRGHHLPNFPGRQQMRRGRRAGASHRRRSSMRRDAGRVAKYGAGGHLFATVDLGNTAHHFPGLWRHLPRFGKTAKHVHAARRRAMSLSASHALPWPIWVWYEYPSAKPARSICLRRHAPPSHFVIRFVSANTRCAASVKLSLTPIS